MTRAADALMAGLRRGEVGSRTGMPGRPSAAAKVARRSAAARGYTWFADGRV